MSGGGGGGQNTVTTQVEKLPAELVPYYQDLLGRGVYETLTGYETYPFRRIADFDPYEAGAQEAYANMALEGTPEALADAQSGIREIAMGSPYQRAIQGDAITQQLASIFQQAGETPDFYEPLTERLPVEDVEVIEGELEKMPPLDESIAQTMSERPQTSSEMQRYMNPFQQTFIDRQKELARQDSARQRSEIGQQAAMAGGLGGYREGIMQAEREKNLMNQMQDIQAAGDMANFQQARQAYESDRQNRMDVADLGLRGFEGIGRDVDRRRGAALDMANLSGQRQAQEIDRLSNLESAGSRRRALAQQGLDIGYQDFLRQQAFPREQLNLYSGLLRGVPVGPGTTKSVYGDQPSGFQQLLGGGLGAAALYGGLRGSSGGWGGSGNSWGGG